MALVQDECVRQELTNHMGKSPEAIKFSNTFLNDVPEGNDDFQAPDPFALALASAEPFEHD